MKKYTTTKKEMFAEVINIINASDSPKKDELVERINHEIELCSKSRSTGEKAQAKAAEDERLTNLILDVLADGKPRTVSEVQAAEPQLCINDGVNTSKVTSLLGIAVNKGLVTKAKDKKKTYYSIPEETEETEATPAE